MRFRPLGKDIPYDLARLYSGETLVEALEGVEEVLVRKAGKVQQCGVEVAQAEGHRRVASAFQWVT